MHAYGLGLVADDLLDDLLGVGIEQLEPIYQQQVVKEVSPWIRRQGESFGQSIVDGTGEVWTPENDPGRAALYQTFARPLVDPFAAGVKDRLEPHAVKLAGATLGPVLILGGLALGFLLGRGTAK